MLLGLQRLFDVRVHRCSLHHELRLSNVSRLRRRVQYPLLFPVLLVGLLRLPVVDSTEPVDRQWAQGGPPCALSFLDAVFAAE
jgi:hypothetical protein